MAVPFGVVTEIWPEPATGVVLLSVVLLAELTTPLIVSKESLLFAAAVSNPDPVTVTGVPGAPIAGLKPVMLGAPGADPTVNEPELVADPAGDVTIIGPVVAPAGTLVTIWLGLDAITVAAVQLNVTVFRLAVALKPVP